MIYSPVLIRGMEKTTHVILACIHPHTTVDRLVSLQKKVSVQNEKVLLKSTFQS